MMSFGLWLVSIVTLLGACCLIFYAWLIWRVAFSEKLAIWQRLIGVIPVLTPIVAWRAGMRIEVIVWAVLLIAYAVLAPRLFA